MADLKKDAAKAGLILEPENVQSMTLFQKLGVVQSELKAPKNQYNSFGRYYYRSCEDIIEAAKPLLAKVGLVLVMRDDIVFIEGRFYIKATAKIIDAATEANFETTAFAREAESKTGSDLAQLTGACSTYARKYALNALLCVDDTKDADTEENANEAQARANKGTTKAAGTKATAKTAAQAPKPTQQPAPQAAPVPDEPVCCAKCNNPIVGTDKFTVQQIIENSVKYLGGKYCFSCGQVIAKELKAKHDAEKAAQGDK